MASPAAAPFADRPVLAKVAAADAEVKAEYYDSPARLQRPTGTFRLPNDYRDLLSLKVEKAEELERNTCVHSEPDSLISPYVERHKEWAEVEHVLSCLGNDLTYLKYMTSDRCKIRTLEYATMSGAGKSRFIMHEFGRRKKFKEIPMSFVGLNFSDKTTGGGSDTDSVIDTILRGGVEVAMSRLLLSRGFFKVHPKMQIFNNNLPLPDASLPYFNVVIEALFQDRFKEEPVGEGLLVVHLDELWQLKNQMKKKLLLGLGDNTAIKRQVNSLVHQFISILLEYSIGNHANKGRYILPVVSHTCPDKDLLENPECDYRFSHTELHLRPFTIDQSIELLQLKRKQTYEMYVNDGNNPNELYKDEINWKDWENVVALAGGHPSLLLDSFPALSNPLEAGALTSISEGSLMCNMMQSQRIESFRNAIQGLARKEMQDFLMDSLLRVEVAVEKHQRVLDAGLGWFQPRTGRTGLVSAPFPITLVLMKACKDGRFSEIGAALNPSGANFSQAKAMEFVSTLTVLLRHMKSVELWRTFNTCDAFTIVEKADQDFFTVWPISNKAVLDFGGRLKGWKILGQTKMQEPGKHTTQSLAEVMGMAWKIGRHVATGKLEGNVHAYWVSSRKAQSQNLLELLVHAFRVAMSGEITKEAAEKEMDELGGFGNAQFDHVEDLDVQEEEVVEGEARPAKKRRALGVLDYIKFLNQKPLSCHYEFTYIGRDCTKQDNSILPLNDLLPNGIVAGWA